jgi:hypothetical protein
MRQHDDIYIYIYSYALSHLFNSLACAATTFQFIDAFNMGSGDFPMLLVVTTFQLINILTMGSDDFLILL